MGNFGGYKRDRAKKRLLMTYLASKEEINFRFLDTI